MKPMVKGNRFYKCRDYIVMEVKGVGDSIYEVSISLEDLMKVIGHSHTWRATEYPNGWVYITSKVGNKTVLLHRYIMDCPEGLVVDHLNHDTLDNRRINLRICTQSDNMKNKKFKGMSYEAIEGGKWRVRRTKNGIKYDLGFFKDYNEALEEAKKLDEKLKEIR